ncbi:acetate--CoA ligase family protein [Nocardioides terrisoli]|uniref:acetate--CoA ligase family protein n=1 Tax=Nocardioides terrisoli TaxID=3388267 RepID=UPI00287BB880|nr:acetate--CoA ligase family protein [Nocardioides marmorisolisilvae]
MLNPIPVPEDIGKKVLSKYGIRTTSQSLVTSVEDLQRWIGQVDPAAVVLKLSMDRLTHKSRVGGVRTGVSPDAAPDAYRELAERGAALTEEYGSLRGVLAEEDAGTGVEVAIGLHVDDDLGPLAMIGNGGSAIEETRCVAFAPAPLDRAAADDLVRRWSRLPGSVAPVIGRSEQASLSDTLVRVAGADGLAMREDIATVDINPIIVTAGSTVAVDAVLIHASDGGSPRAWLSRMSAAMGVEAPALRALFDPTSVAVVGASGDETKAGNRLTKNLIDFGYRGALYPIHPTAASILGLPAYRALRDVPGPVDKAIVLVGSGQVPDVIGECVEAGVEVAQIYSAGFSEYAGSEAALEGEILARIQGTTTRVVGPNCWGAYSPRSRITTTTADAAGIRDGGVAFISQSGTHFVDIVRRSSVRGLPLYGAASVGNCLDVKPHEFARFLLDDERVTVLGLYLEGTVQARQLAEVAAASTKPVVVMRGGRSEAGSQAASSHTAALATDDAAWTAVMAAAGVVVVDTIEEMMDALSAIDLFGRLAGPRLTVLGTGGGVAVTAADVATTVGLEVAAFTESIQQQLSERFGSPGTSMANPVDLAVWNLFPSDASAVADLLGVVADPAVTDSCIAYLEMGSLFDMSEHGRAQRLIDLLLADMEKAAVGKKLSLVLRSGGAAWEDEIVRAAERRLRAAGVGVYFRIQDAVRAHAAVWRASSRPAAVGG